MVVANNSQPPRKWHNKWNELWIYGTLRPLCGWNREIYDNIIWLGESSGGRKRDPFLDDYQELNRTRTLTDGPSIDSQRVNGGDWQKNLKEMQSFCIQLFDRGALLVINHFFKPPSTVSCLSFPSTTINWDRLEEIPPFLKKNDVLQCHVIQADNGCE